MNNDHNVLRCNCNYSLMLMIFMKHSTRSTVDLFNVVRKIAKITTCTIDRWESRSVRSIFFLWLYRPRSPSSVDMLPSNERKRHRKTYVVYYKNENIIIYNYFYTKKCIKRYKKASIQVYYLV